MIVLVCLRNLVPFTFVDEEGMLGKKMSIMPGSVYADGEWNTGISLDYEYTDLFKPVAIYANYTNDPDDYIFSLDKLGSRYFGPTHCVKTEDYNRPR